MTPTTTDGADLRSQIAAVENRQLALIAERDELAFSAIVERDKTAVARVAAINDELTHLSQELPTLKAASAGAAKRAAAAQAAERDDVERAMASEAIELLASFEKRGAALDEAFDKSIAEYTALSEEFRRFETLGYAPTTYPMVRVTMKSALLSKLMFTDLQVEHLAPKDRRTFIGAIERLASSIRNRATARLTRNPAAKAA